MISKKLTSAFLIITFVFSGLAIGQNSSSIPEDAIERIKAEGMTKSQVMQTLSYMTDVIGSRLTGSPGMKRANEWTRDTMAKWGLQNAHLESWGPFGRGWAVRKYSAAVVEPQFNAVISYPRAWSPATKGAVKSEVVLLDAKTPEEMAKYKGQLRGKIVLLSGERPLKAIDKPLMTRISDAELAKMAAEPQPKDDGEAIPIEALRAYVKSLNDGAKKMKFLIDEGAAVVVHNSGQGSGGTFFGDGAQVGVETPEIKTIEEFFESPAFQPQNKKYESSMLPQITMASEDYNRLVRTIKQGVKPVMSIEIDSQYYDDDPNGYNTIAEIPGTDPKLKDEVVMLGAHLDSWHSSTGATDNAAGSAAVMEAVRIIMASGLKPRRTIRVALWSGEEQGLYGSAAYVKKHFGEKKNGTIVKGAGYEKLSAYYNLDNGTGKIRGVYMQGNPNVRSLFESWLSPFGDLGAKTLTLANTGGTDHLPFDAIGLPGFQFIQDPVEYGSRTHHSNQDNFDRIQADDMKQASTIIAAFVYQTAMMDEKLPRKNLIP